MNGKIGAITLFGYKVEAHGRFAGVGNPNPHHASLIGTGSVEVYRFDPSLGTYSYYGVAQSGNATTSGTGGSSLISTDQYGKSFDFYNNVFIVGDSNFDGQYDYVLYPYKSLVDVFLLNQTSSVQDTLQDTLKKSTKINSPIGTGYNTFGNSVSLNSKHIVVGANGSGDGKVYVYNYITGSNYITISGPAQQINAVRSGKKFGTIVRIDKSGSDSILISEDSTSSNSRVYLYDSSSTGWTLSHTFSPITGSKNVPFDDFESYDYTKNSTDGFGADIQINGDTIVIGAPNDASYYEYAGSTTLYNRGAVYFYNKVDCPTDYTELNNTGSIYYQHSQSYWDLVSKYIGDKNTIKGNKLGCSVDVYDNKILVGCISSSNSHAGKSEISASISQSYNLETPLILGQYEMFEKSGSVVTQVTYDYKKKTVGYPYMSYGYDVAISEKAIFIGSPFIISDFPSGDIFTVSPSVSQESLTNMRGHVYISTLDSLRTNFHAGNVFYRNGDIVLSNTGSQFYSTFKTTDTDEYMYDLTYNSYYTINERSIICTINPGEFNVSSNITALDVVDPVFDLHGDGEFDFRDLNLILLYIVDINTPGSPNFATDDTVWDDYVIEDDTERSLFEYYKSKYEYGRYTLKVEYSQFYNKVRALEPKFDFDGDGKITINDAKILWKHFVKKLDDKSYPKLINPLSSRKTLGDVMEYLTSVTSKYAETDGVPTLKKEFAEYNYSASLDITGSYLAPYITTIGLYSGSDLVAIAKLSSPIKNSGEYPLNFLIKWDV